MRIRASWSGSSRPTEYKVAGANFCAAIAGSPRYRRPDRIERANVLAAVKNKPAAALKKRRS